MRTATLVVGVLIVLAGVYLVSTHGTIGGTNILSALGIPCFGGFGGFGGNSSNSSSSCFGPYGYSVGGILVIVGLPLILQGLTAPSMPKMPTMPQMPFPMSPEAMAGLSTSRFQSAAGPAAMGAGAAVAPFVAPKGPTRFCPECGQPNSLTAKFCHQCGKPMPPPPA